MFNLISTYINKQENNEIMNHILKKINISINNNYFNY